MKLRVALVVAALVGGAACRNSPDAKPEAPSNRPDPWQAQAKEKQPLARPLLWAAERGGATTYLLGTMHVGVDPEARLPQFVWDKLDAAGAFAVETDITDPALGRIGERRGGTLREELGPAYWQKLEKALGASIAQAFEHKSAMIPATILALRGLPETPPMDTVLLGRAKQQQKKIVFLELAAHQVAMLEKHMNAKALKLMLDDLPKLEQQTKAMLAAYLTGDEAAILAITDDQGREAIEHGYSKSEYDEMMEDLLYRRNAAWIAPIEAMHGSAGAKPAFVAVGAAHLIGPRSVLELLQKQGFQITRVTP